MHYYFPCSYLPICADKIELALVCDSEREAAKALGFTKVKWDNWSGQEPQPQTLEKNWGRLTEDEQAAARKLGFTQLIWDTQQPDVLAKFWSALTDSEKKAAGMLGFTELSWDNKSGQEIQPDAYNKMWSQLTEEEQFGLDHLGFHQTSWDNSPLALPQTFSKRWGDLTKCGENPFVPHPLPLLR